MSKVRAPDKIGFVGNSEILLRNTFFVSPAKQKRDICTAFLSSSAAAA